MPVEEMDWEENVEGSINSKELQVISSVDWQHNQIAEGAVSIGRVRRLPRRSSQPRL